MKGPDWHLNKAVSLSIIGALLVYAAAFVWYASEMNATVAQHSRDISRLSQEQTRASRETNQQAVQLARIEENTRHLATQIDALVRQLERRFAEPD